MEPGTYGDLSAAGLQDALCDTFASFKKPPPEFVGMEHQHEFQHNHQTKLCNGTIDDRTQSELDVPPSPSPHVVPLEPPAFAVGGEISSVSGAHCQCPVLPSAACVLIRSFSFLLAGFRHELLSPGIIRCGATLKLRRSSPLRTAACTCARHSKLFEGASIDHATLCKSRVDGEWCSLPARICTREGRVRSGSNQHATISRSLRQSRVAHSSAVCVCVFRAQTRP
eukprot:1454480-Pleurochrysis_carterae.AAC.1